MLIWPGYSSLWRRSNLARRSMFAALVAAIIRLFWSRRSTICYSVPLIDTISRSRTEADLEAVARGDFSTPVPDNADRGYMLSLV